MKPLTLDEEFIWEIGYYMAKSKIHEFDFEIKQNWSHEAVINYNALTLAHQFWRDYRKLDKNGIGR
jgi:hypothetical protein